ncbi:MAG: hypothetical protein JW940_27180 [Polyangiaceae bacterium]|nr:hypothetical protein [Polyangiaceae bacterium]
MTAEPRDQRDPLASPGTWRRCSSCKGDIGFGETYYVCSVSTCNTARAPLTFCSLECWQSHVPAMRHRDAWAEERRSPSAPADPSTLSTPRGEGTASAASDETRRRRVVSSAAEPDEPDSAHEVLIVASKLKAYVREVAEMNTSDRVFTILSDHLRELARRAARHARDDGRKTVLDRDFYAVLKELK